MVYLCTFFDSRYMRQGLALHRSLIEQRSPFHLWVLCMDAQAHAYLKAADLPHLSLLTLEDIASSDPDIHTAKANRSTVELYFSSKSFLCRHLFDTHPQIDLLTYLDADMFFFSSPEAITREMDGCSVGLTPHRFPPHQKHREQYGLFNAGFISIRRDASGLACLDWWRKSCFEWCHDRVSEGRFADQGYLSMMPTRFPGVHSISSRGINAAPWNISQFSITQDTEHVMVERDRLVLYHFHGVRRVWGGLYDAGFAGYRDVMSQDVRRLIYRPYLAALAQCCAPDVSPDGERNIRTAHGRFSRFRSAMPALWNILIAIRTIAKGICYRSLMTAPAGAQKGMA